MFFKKVNFRKVMTGTVRDPVITGNTHEAT